MDKKEIFKGECFFGGIIPNNDRNNEFDIFRKKADKLKEEILSTRSCYDYVLKEIEKENKNIDNLMKYNQKRLSLLIDLGNRIEKLNDQLEDIYKDVFDCMINDICKSNNNLNKI